MMEISISEIVMFSAPQSSPFATHLNMLRLLGTSGKAEKVLELGGGEFSTNTFLDRQWYANLTKLLTIESDPDWAELVDKEGDVRHTVVIAAEPIEPELAKLILDDFDLILVDNSTSGERRCETLRWVAKHVGRSLVVAHDYDVESYREACDGFDHALVDDRQRPWTALLWNTW